ncbi:hypothetical protein CALVIDRAFT_600013 [Calocera viscosa TUFC12733]|uniref:Uncharacterized protein n=1 Tax=Calocera viscosa (strain TUFC12733) TaxID=1330018 RepID=A0A167K7X3_CALVF|nr:hypothetical protein CALVIDRAFT_600013 [Calocera viscosa TUFC12733]
MPVRIRPRPPPSITRPLPSRQHATSASSSASPYHEKVSALPFRISPTEARQTFGNYALAELTPDISGIPGFMRDYREHVRRNGRRLSDLWFKTPKMRAMYVPTWFVSTDVSLSYPIRGPNEIPNILGTVDGTIPGHAHYPLSNVWLGEPYRASAQPSPFEPSMLTTPWGDAVTPIKYTVSPLKMLEIWGGSPVADLRNQLLGAKTIALGFGPLLKPVYVAEVSQVFRPQKTTVVLPAWIDRYHDITWMWARTLFLSMYVYGPREKDGLPSLASVTSEDTATYPHWAFSMKAKGGTSPSDQKFERAITELLGSRQNSVDWSSIGGVTDEMWEDRRIVSIKGTPGRPNDTS